MAERRRREDASPMPDLRVLGLPDPRPHAQEKTATLTPVDDAYGDEVFRRSRHARAMPLTILANKDATLPLILASSLWVASASEI